MRLSIIEFESFEAAVEARNEFPKCAHCKTGTKVQWIDGRWLLVCMRNTAHRGISNWRDEE